MEQDKSHPKHISTQCAINKVKILLRGGTGDFRTIKSDRDTGFYPFYVATNENLEYLSKLDISEKDTLTVTGSGDHAINLAFFGAKSVETFDINKLTFIAFDLKKTALLHLTRSEFADFYGTPYIINKQLYEKVSPYLKDVTRAVFDTILENQQNSYVCLEETTYIKQNLLLNNPYMYSEQTYKEAQMRLKNLKYPIINRACPVNKLDKLFSPKDVVILSNILQYSLRNNYANDDFNFGTKERAAEFVQSLSKTLKQGGVVSLLYMFSSGRTDEKLKSLINLKTRSIVVKGNIRKNLNQVILADKEDFPEME